MAASGILEKIRNLDEKVGQNPNNFNEKPGLNLIPSDSDDSDMADSDAADTDAADTDTTRY